jgi:hypothetical protein
MLCQLKAAGCDMKQPAEFNGIDTCLRWVKQGIHLDYWSGDLFLEIASFMTEKEMGG